MSKTERRQKRSTGIMLSYVNTALNMVIGLFLSSFLIRMLGDTEYGIYQTVASFANYLILFEFGTGTVITRNLLLCRNQNKSQKEIDSNVSTIIMITHLLAAVILLASAVFFVSLGRIYSSSMTPDQINYGRIIFIFVTLQLVLTFYTQTFNGIVIAYEHYTYQSRMSIIRKLVRLCLLVILVSLTRYSLVIAIVDSVLSGLFLAYVVHYCKKNFVFTISRKYFDLNILKESLPLCFAIFLQTVVNQANNNVDKFVLGIRMSPSIVTLYSIGLYIYSVFSSLTTIPISLYAPHVSKAITSGLKDRELTQSLIQPCRLITLVGGTVLFGFIAVGKQFISIVYGTNYLEAYYVAVIIMIPMFINMSNGIVVNVLDVLNKRLTRSIILMITTVANVILTVAWVGRWGMIGASVATAVCTLCGQILIMNIYYSKKIGIKVFYLFREAYKGLLPYQLIGMLVVLLLNRMIESNLIGLLLGGILYLIISFGGFLIWGRNEEEDRMVKNIVQKMLGFLRKSAH